MLIILGGLPGAGKTTIAKQIATQLKAVYLRIDTIEQTYKKFSKIQGPEGYEIAYLIAADNLQLGLHVVADSVNPIAITRNAWQKVAIATKVPFIEVELICSDLTIHQNRIETRKADIPGHNLPTWQEVLQREYESWTSKSITLDTSLLSIEDCVAAISPLYHA